MNHKVNPLQKNTAKEVAIPSVYDFELCKSSWDTSVGGQLAAVGDLVLSLSVRNDGHPAAMLRPPAAPT
jgi:hypothetical protein